MAASVGMLGLLWICAGAYKLNAMKSRRSTADAQYGSVSSIRVSKNQYVAIVDYETPSGEKRKLTWDCDCEPSFGQSVLLRPSADRPNEMEIADSTGSLSTGLFFVGVGLCMIFIALFVIPR